MAKFLFAKGNEYRFQIKRQSVATHADRIYFNPNYILIVAP